MIFTFFPISCEKPELASDRERVHARELIAASDNYPAPPVESVRSLEPTEIPAEVTIRNSSGKTLEGTLLAKKGSEIAFRRKQDNRLFLISFDTLDGESQRAIGQFPDAETDKLADLKSNEEEAASKPEERIIPRGDDYPTDLAAARDRSRESGYPLMIIIVGENRDQRSAGVASMVGVTGARNTTPGSKKAKAKAIHEKFQEDIVDDIQFRRFAYRHFEPVLVDLLGAPDEDLLYEIRNQLLVNKFPSVVILHEGRREIARMEGYDRMGASRFIEHLEEAAGIGAVRF